MDSNDETVQKHVVVNTPYQRSEVLTERTQSVPREPRSSTGTIAIVAVLAISAIAVVLYLVINRNANESANRNANLEVASQTNSHQTQPTTIIQQPAQQAPAIIQQPAPAQQALVIIQQPAQPNQRENTSANDDANIAGHCHEKASRRSEYGWSGYDCHGRASGLNWNRQFRSPKNES